jgi:hypothetical protein
LCSKPAKIHATEAWFMEVVDPWPEWNPVTVVEDDDPIIVEPRWRSVGALHALHELSAIENHGNLS